MPSLMLQLQQADGRNLHQHLSSNITDYYATWVLDLDGHDVEVVNKTGQIDSTSLTYNQ